MYQIFPLEVNESTQTAEFMVPLLPTSTDGEIVSVGFSINGQQFVWFQAPAETAMDTDIGCFRYKIPAPTEVAASE